MHRRRNQWILLLMLFSMIFTTSCMDKNAEPEKISKDIFTMDTMINITAYARDLTKGREAVEQAAGEFQRINDLVGRFPGEHLPDTQKSDIIRLNEKAGIAPVTVSDDTLAMVGRAIYCAKLSAGAFDITIGPVMDLWGFGGEQYHVPTEDELNRVLPLTDYRKIIIDKEAKTIFLPEKGMIMDLGGIAKGYATDLAVQKLRAGGIESALVNAGGNVFALGSKPDGSPWQIGIQDPRDSTAVAAILSVTDKAVISSGDYERYFEEKGVRYHHIIDPASGRPARGVMGTTIVTNNSTDGDIFSTLMFVLGPEKGMALQKTWQEMEVVFITDQKEIIYSHGLDGLIEFTNQTDYSVRQSL